MVEVIGAIRDRWLFLGGPASFLGNPVTDELQMPGAEGGRVSVFERGSIYWWPDVNGGRAVDVGEMFVHYQGLNCFGETSGAGSDEPYVVFAVTAGGQPLPAVRTPIFNGVEDGASRPHQMLLYRGQPRGITITAVLIEHDSGDPERYLERLRAVTVASAGAIVGAVVAVAPLGPVIAVPVAAVLGVLREPIAEKLSDLIGLGDDVIGSWTFVLSPKQMITTALQPNSREKAVDFKVQPVPLLAGHGGSYKVYFGMSKAP